MRECFLSFNINMTFPRSLVSLKDIRSEILSESEGLVSFSVSKDGQTRAAAFLVMTAKN